MNNYRRGRRQKKKSCLPKRSSLKTMFFFGVHPLRLAYRMILSLSDIHFCCMENVLLTSIHEDQENILVRVDEYEKEHLNSDKKHWNIHLLARMLRSLYLSTVCHISYTAIGNIGKLGYHHHCHILQFQCIVIIVTFSF